MRAALVLANADVVIGDVVTLEWFHQCVGSHAEQVALVDPADDAAFAHELHAAIDRHRHDKDVTVARLIRGQAFAASVDGNQMLAREIELVAAEGVAYEVIPGASPLLPARRATGVALPRSGPLVGMRVIVARAAHQATTLTDLLCISGAMPILVPVIEILTSDAMRLSLSHLFEEISPPDWVVFSSQNAVSAVVDTPGGLAYLSHLKVACVGRATARACARSGIAVEFVPSRSNSASFVAEFPKPSPSGTGRVIFFAGNIAGSRIDRGLHGLGYVVERVVVYETASRTISPFVQYRAKGADAALFTSPSTVNGAVRVFGAAHLPKLIVSIGPTTSAAIREFGLEVSVEADEQTSEALVDALIRVIE